MRTLLLALIAAVVSCTPAGITPRPHGDEFGNGGDPIAKRFERGRVKAERMMARVTSLDPADLVGERALIDWYRDHRLRLLDELRALPPFRWVARNANGACGATSTEPGAAITLAYEHCRDVATDTEAALHLVGEVAHHLGVADDALTARVAESLRRAWIRTLALAPEAGALRLTYLQSRTLVSAMLLEFAAGARPPVLRSMSEAGWRELAARLRDGARSLARREVEWVDEVPGDASVSGCGNWNRGAIRLAYEGCEPARQAAVQTWLLLAIPDEVASGLAGSLLRATLARVILADWLRTGGEIDPHLARIATPARGLSHAAWSGARLVAWGEEAYRDPESVLGVFSPRTREWSYERVRNPAASARASASVVTGGDDPIALFVCQGNPTGLRLRPDERRWQTLGGELPARRDFLAVAGGTRLVRWGGTGCESDAAFFADGGIWDGGTGTWAPFAAPAGVSIDRETSAITLAGQQRVAIWGLGSGALYDPATGHWTMLPARGAPSPRRAPQMVWTGNALLVMGDGGGAIWRESSGRWEPVSARGVPAWPLFRLFAGHGFVTALADQLYRYSPEENRWIEAARPLFLPPFGLDFFPAAYGWVAWPHEATKPAYFIFP